jgi:hypothetical protein
MLIVRASRCIEAIGVNFSSLLVDFDRPGARAIELNLIVDYNERKRRA